MSKETKCNLINCLTGHTCGRNIENAKEPKCNHHCVLIAESKLPDEKEFCSRCKKHFMKCFCDSPQKEEPKCVFNNPEFCGVSHTCISSSKEEPKESFEERTAKKLDNDILDKICEEPKEWEEWTIDNNSPTEKEFKKFISEVESKAKQEIIAKVRENVEEECEKICGKEQKYRSNGCIHLRPLQILDKLKGI